MHGPKTKLNQLELRLAKVQKAPFPKPHVIQQEAEKCTLHKQSSKLFKTWEPIDLHPKQLAKWESDSRFVITAAGRRSLKTVLTLRKAIVRILSSTKRGRFIFGAPTFGQAVDIFWERLIDALPPWAVKDINITRRKIFLHNNTVIEIIGSEARKRAEGGLPVLGVVIDEFGDTDSQLWPATLRPMLMDTQGWAELLGKSTGRNHYYYLAQTAQKESELWDYHHWKSSEVLPHYLGEEVAEIEIKEIKANTDPQTYALEYDSEWLEITGGAYHQFSEENIVDNYNYDPNKELFLCFDFNVSPGVCCLVQKFQVDVAVDEVWVEKGSNTDVVCDYLIKKILKQASTVYLYGDPAGGHTGTAKLQGTDWDIIKRKLSHFNIVDKVRQKAPPIVVRLNEFNRRLCNANQERTFLIDRKCQHLIDDMRGVVRTEKGIDDGGNSLLTHMSDAVGYYLHACTSAKVNTYAFG